MVVYYFQRSIKMKKIKITVLAALILFCTAFSAFSQTPSLADLQTEVGKFSESLAKSLPFNSTIGLNWSDAYIGKFLPSVPPHFGAGVAIGFTSLDFDSFDKLLDMFVLDMPNLPTMFIPGYVAEARIGGFFLPFDVGLKFGILPPIPLLAADKKMDYLLVGGELRYAVLDEKKKPLLPNVSVGVGVNYLAGSLALSRGDISYDFDLPAGSNHTLALKDPTINLLWKTTSIDLKAQISKSLLILTPYFGFGANLGWSQAGYTAETTPTLDGNALDAAGIDTIKSYLDGAGLTSMDFDDGISSIIKNYGWGFRIFGGTSFNFTAIRLDLTGMYNLRDKMYGVSVGVRFQI
jgi:hypothetical protein